MAAERARAIGKRVALSQREILEPETHSLLECPECRPCVADSLDLCRGEVWNVSTHEQHCDRSFIYVSVTFGLKSQTDSSLWFARQKVCLFVCPFV